jgi:DNA-directed RNA polymerase specialized sigma24 family protein
MTGILPLGIAINLPSVRPQTPAADKMGVDGIFSFLRSWSKKRSCEISQIETETIKLCQQHLPILLRYAANATSDQTVIEDGIREAFHIYFAARIKRQQIKYPRAWLAHVLRKYILDCNRNSKVSGFSFLSPSEQECVNLRMAGFSLEEIAAIMDIKWRRAGRLLLSALEKIRKSGLLEKH